MEHCGYYLWEGIIFLTQVLVAMGLLVLRRKANGRPSFTNADRQLFFGRARIQTLTPQFWTNFAIAALLCFFVGLLMQLVLAPFGAGILATAQLIAFIGIVKKALC
jgi:hypothetical protein